MKRVLLAVLVASTVSAVAEAQEPQERPSISSSQRTHLRRMGIKTDAEIEQYLRETGAINRQRRSQVLMRRRTTTPARVQVARAFQAQAAANQAAMAQAEAQRQAAIASRPRVQPVYVPLLPPAPNSGPFYETVQHTGNQTWITGSGPYGPFSETISRTGNQTWINGSGPLGPFSETIQRTGNQTFVNGSGFPPGPFWTW